VSCTTTNPNSSGPEVAMLQLQAPEASGMSKPQSGTNMQPHPTTGDGKTVSDGPAMGVLMPASYEKFTSQIELGKYLTSQYHIRTPNELSSCETCHR